jgi:hypothetical protein
MKKFVYVASIALLSCGFAMAQTDSSTQGTSNTQNPQGTSATPQGDRRDRYGDTVAPDGTVTPKGTNTPGSSSNSPSNSPSSMGGNTSNSRGTAPTPPGDRRDRYGDTVAPDGTDTPKGTNTPGTAPQTAAPDAK